MKLGLIINCMGYSKNVYPLTQKLVREILPELRKLGIEAIFRLPHGDWVKSQIKSGHTKILISQDQKKVKKALTSSNNKGIIVRHFLEEFKKREDILWVLHIDGSGKFDLRDIVKIIKFTFDPSIDSILAKRDVSGMNKFRTVVEDFERELILQKFKDVEIKDGQCGCWCLRLEEKFKPELELTANGYEIELDILISLLKRKKNIWWLPVKIEVTGISKFQFINNLSKLQWLCTRLKIKKDEVLKIAKKFQQKNKESIKEAEKESIELDLCENTFNNYLTEIKKILSYLESA